MTTEPAIFGEFCYRPAYATGDTRDENAFESFRRLEHLKHRVGYKIGRKHDCLIKIHSCWECISCTGWDTYRLGVTTTSHRQVTSADQHSLADLKRGHAGANGVDDAGQFASRTSRQWWHPGIPSLADQDIRAADPNCSGTDHDLAGPRYGHRPFNYFQYVWSARLP